MVTLDTLRKLHEHDHELAAYCPKCRRWAVLDLERPIAEGRGEYCFVGRKPRCSYCRYMATQAACNATGDRWSRLHLTIG